MKRTLRPFVVETKQGKKPRSWVAELEAEVMSPSRKKAELTAAEVFGDKRTRPAAEATSSGLPRVLPDLSQDVAPPPPAAVETSEPDAQLHAEADDGAQAERPRRTRAPRTRRQPVAVEPVEVEVDDVVVTAATDEPELADLDDLFDDEADEAFDEVLPQVSAEAPADGPTEGLRARRLQRKQLAKAQLPRGQRWKHRIHPAAW